MPYMYVNPMPFIPAVNTAQIRAQFDYQDEQCENVHYVESQSAWTAETLLDLAEFYASWWTVNVQPSVPETLALVRVLVRDMTTASGLAVEFTGGLPANGEQAVEALPNNVTLAIKWTTGFSGRSFRGRTYFLGLADSGVNGNIAAPTTITNISGWYQDFLDGIPAANADWALVVASFYSGVDANGDPIPRSTAVLTPVIGLSIDNVIDSQRRRLPGRGS